MRNPDKYIFAPSIFEFSHNKRIDELSKCETLKIAAWGEDFKEMYPPPRPLEQILKEYSCGQIELFYNHFVTGKAMATIAREIGCSCETPRTHVNRFLGRLRQSRNRDITWCVQEELCGMDDKLINYILDKVSKYKERFGVK